jgi:hypothetical protein
MNAPRTPTELIEAITASNERHITAIAAQLAASDALAAYHLLMVDSLLGQPNRRTGKDHSISSAENVADESEEGRRLITVSREAAAAVSRGHAAFVVAKLRAELAVKLAGAA